MVTGYCCPSGQDCMLRNFIAHIIDDAAAKLLLSRVLGFAATIVQLLVGVGPPDRAGRQ